MNKRRPSKRTKTVNRKSRNPVAIMHRHTKSMRLMDKIALTTLVVMALFFIV